MPVPSFHQPRPAEREADLREPMPWMSRERAAGPYRLPGLRRPIGAVIYGLVLISLGVAALMATSATGRSDALVCGVLMLVIAAGLGAWMVIIGAVRWTWYRKYVQQHGHPPF